MAPLDAGHSLELMRERLLNESSETVHCVKQIVWQFGNCYDFAVFWDRIYMGCIGVLSMINILLGFEVNIAPSHPHSNCKSKQIEHNDMNYHRAANEYFSRNIPVRRGLMKFPPRQIYRAEGSACRNEFSNNERGSTLERDGTERSRLTLTLLALSTVKILSHVVSLMGDVIAPFLHDAPFKDSEPMPPWLSQKFAASGKNVFDISH